MHECRRYSLVGKELLEPPPPPPICVLSYATSVILKIIHQTTTVVCLLPAAVVVVAVGTTGRRERGRPESRPQDRRAAFQLRVWCLQPLLHRIT